MHTGGERTIALTDVARAARNEWHTLTTLAELRQAVRTETSYIPKYGCQAQNHTCFTVCAINTLIARQAQIIDAAIHSQSVINESDLCKRLANYTQNSKLWHRLETEVNDDSGTTKLMRFRLY